jgi:CheY-like chemotaxis protein
MNMSFTPRILLVEDDPQDAFLVQRHLSDLPYGGELMGVSGIHEAQARLMETADIACVMVDLKLADGSGATLIEWMLDQPTLKDIPVIVFSGDRSQHPELDTFSNVACLIQKPSSASGYEALAQALRPIVSSALARSVYAAQ